MNNFEKLQSMSVEELAKWLDKNGIIDNSPWLEDFNNKYCANCESVMCKYEDAEAAVGFKPLFSDDEIECAYCEIYKKCQYFEDLPEVPDGKEMAKLWLESEAEDNV
jgi:hypothetical protein